MFQRSVIPYTWSLLERECTGREGGKFPLRKDEHHAV